MLYQNKIDVLEFDLWKKNFLQTKKYAEFIEVCKNWKTQFKLLKETEGIKSNFRDVTFCYENYDANLYLIFWYDYILNRLNYDDLVLDIGCGNHIFKSLYPNHNIIGVDKGNYAWLYYPSNNIQAHLRDLDKYKGKLSSAFCFNSIHFTNDKGFKSNLEYLSELLQKNSFAVIFVNNRVINYNRREHIKNKTDCVNQIYDTISNSNFYDLMYFKSNIKCEYFGGMVVRNIHLVIKTK